MLNNFESISMKLLGVRRKILKKIVENFEKKNLSYKTEKKVD